MSLRIKTKHLFLLLATLLTAAQPCSRAGEHVRDFGFLPIEIYQFNHGTSDILAYDFNNDGLDDIIFINNHASRVEILLRKPDNNGPETTEPLPLVEDRFENIGVVADQHVTAFCVADFDNTGRPDLLTVGKQLGLFLRRQTEAGHLASPEKIYLRDTAQIHTIAAADMNDNGLPDMLVAHRDKIEILWNDTVNPFRRRSDIKLSAGECSGMDICDVNRDGYPDILVYMGSDTFPFRVYLGDGSGNFGEENMVRHPPARLARKLDFPGDTRILTGSILPNGNIFRLSEMTTEVIASFMNKDELLPVRTALEGITLRNIVSWTVVDIENDDYLDLCIAAPELSQLHFFKSSASGIASQPIKVDSLSGVSALTTTRSGDVIAYSSSEKAAALHMMNELDRFPAILPAPMDVNLVFANPADDTYFCLARPDGQKTFILETRTLPNGETTRKIEGDLTLGDPPDAVKAFSLGAEGVGLLFFSPHRPPKMFTVLSNMVQEIPASSFRALNHALPHSAFSILNSNGHAEISVAQGENVRSYRLENGVWTPFSQYTPDTESARVTACVYNKMPDATGTPGIFIYDSAGTDIVFSEFGESVFKRIHLPLRLDDFKGLELLGNTSNGETILALITGNSLYTLRDNALQFKTIPLTEYTSPSEKASLREFEVVFTGPDMRRFIALIDTHNRALELVAFTNNILEEQLIFEVFSDSGFSRRRSGETYEPRAVISGDFNGDGAGDLAVLVHDKLIIYPGE